MTQDRQRLNVNFHFTSQGTRLETWFISNAPYTIMYYSVIKRRPNLKLNHLSELCAMKLRRFVLSTWLPV